MNKNIFRILGDLSHISSKCILIWAIHRNKSAEGTVLPPSRPCRMLLTDSFVGVSLLTQILYALVFVTRYLDLFRASGWGDVWNDFFKIFYIVSSFYIILLMMRMYPRTREKERAWKLALWSVGGSIVLAPIILPIFYGRYPYHWFTEVSRSLALLSNDLLIWCLLDVLGFFHHLGIRLRSSTAPAPTSNHRPHCNRLLLPSDAGLLSRLLHPKLACAWFWF